VSTPEDRTRELPEDFRPVGTIALLAVFIVVMVLLWFSVYLVMLSRGPTG
jgi:hypothetical protein